MARRLLLGFVLGAALASATWAQALTTVTGMVTNAATGRALEGASVTIQGTNAEVLTDSEGVYHLPNVSPGRVSIVVSYTGLDSMVIPLEVAAGATVRRDVGLTAQIYQLGAFVVSGEREGNAQAITLQRQSAGVKSIASADAFGALAGNPADLVARLPGVEGESVGGDIRYVRIRGMNHNLNTITMDGNRMADAASAGATREYQFQQIGSDTIERIEVTKSPTPDMDADSIGGAVNMVSKNAFERVGDRRINGSIGWVWRPLDERDDAPRPNFSISYSEVFGKKFGVSFNYGFRSHGSIIDVTTQTHELLPVTRPDGPAYTYAFGTTDFRNIRTRWGGGLRLDYKWSSHTRFFLNTTLNLHNEKANQLNTAYATAQTIATRDAAGNLTGTGAIIPGYTDSVTEWRPVVQSVLTQDAMSTHKDGKTLHSQFGAVHRYGGLEIDWDLYRSNSKADYPGNRTFEFVVRGIGLRIERKDEPYFPEITQTAGPDIRNISSYPENHYLIARMTGWDKYQGAALNVKKPLMWPMPIQLKAGLRFRQQTRVNENRPLNIDYVGPDGVEGPNPANGGINDDNLAQFVDPQYRLPDTRLAKYPKLPYPQQPNRDAPNSTYASTGFNVETALRTTPQYFRQTPADVTTDTTTLMTGDTSFKEDISAAYLQGSTRLGRLTLLVGARLEKTETEGEGALSGITPAERARRAAFTGALTQEEARRRVLAEFTGREERTGKYTEVFPGLHFKYELFRGLVTRLSYATNIGRPAISQLIPRTIVNYDNLTLSTSNPSLKPQYADNYDLSAEYYFEPAGVVSGGVFVKEIKQFIYSAGGNIVQPGTDNGFDGQYAGYTLTTQFNGGSAKVKGFELNYSQQFTFLPGWMKGLGAFANYTRMDVKGTYGTGLALASLAPTSEVAGFNPESANAGISYIRNGITLRVQFNHVGRYLNTFNANQSRLLYRKARSVVDIKTVFPIGRQMSFYLDVVNVFAEGDRVLEYYGGRPQVMHKMSPQFFFGFNGRM